MNETRSPNTNGNSQLTNSPNDPTGAVTWRDYLRIFYRGRFAILITFLVFFVGSIVLTFSTAPVYEASVRLMLVDQASVGQSLFEFTSMITKETLMNNQV